MAIAYSVKVSTGKRESNDDRALIDGQVISDRLVQGECEFPCVAAVCDGCGGYDGGYEAAQTVLGVLAGEEPGKLLDSAYLAEVLDRCRAAVYEKKEEMPQFSSMCTTVAGCVFGEEETVFFHAGDSRVYRFDGRFLAQMTVDHSAVQVMVDMGQLTPEEALVSPDRNIINRCIGMECPPPEIYVSKSAIMPGEMYLICSDGLWEGITKQQLREVLSSGISFGKLAETLVELAMENGSDDNITVCICAVQPSGV